MIQVVAKYNRCRGIGQITEVSKQEAEQNLVKELADVEICLEQVKFLLNLDKDVKQAKQEALDKATKPTSLLRGIQKSTLSWLNRVLSFGDLQRR